MTVSGTSTSIPLSESVTVTAGTGAGAQQKIAVTGTETKLSQAIDFPAIANQTKGVKLTLTATARSALAVSFTSSTLKVCTVSGKTASLIAAGTCTIRPRKRETRNTRLLRRSADPSPL